MHLRSRYILADDVDSHNPSNMSSTTAPIIADPVENFYTSQTFLVIFTLFTFFICSFYSVCGYQCLVKYLLRLHADEEDEEDLDEEVNSRAVLNVLPQQDNETETIVFAPATGRILLKLHNASERMKLLESFFLSENKVRMKCLLKIVAWVCLLVTLLHPARL